MIGTLTIRADCSPSIGTGHIMRMIALGQAWKDLGGKVLFLGSTAPLTKHILSEGFSAVHCDNLSTPSDQIEQILKLTSKKDWIILDGYQFDFNYMNEIRQRGRKVVVVDDTCDRDAYSADILLNQNPEAKSFQYAINNDSICLFGFDYTLIRREFLKSSRNNSSKSIPQLLVTMGGSDPTGMSHLILNILLESTAHQFHCTLLAGPANTDKEALQEQLKLLPTSYTFLTSTNDMPSLLSATNLAITAAGSTCWELCYLGIPFLAIRVADNQSGVCTQLEKNNAALCVESTDPDTELRTAINALLTDSQLRKRLSGNAMKLIDGNGAKRVAKTIYNSGITLRNATLSDSRQLFDWRNDPIVRENSFNSDKITLSTHEAWFSHKLEDPKCLFFIAEDHQGNAIGQLRFDILEHEATISLAVSPSMNNLGIGTTITHQACQKLRKKHPDIVPVAFVKPENASSCRMFKKCGFLESLTPDKQYIRFDWGCDN